MPTVTYQTQDIMLPLSKDTDPETPVISGYVYINGMCSSFQISEINYNDDESMQKLVDELFAIIEDMQRSLGVSDAQETSYAIMPMACLDNDEDYIYCHMRRDVPNYGSIGGLFGEDGHTLVVSPIAMRKVAIKGGSSSRCSQLAPDAVSLSMLGNALGKGIGIPLLNFCPINGEDCHDHIGPVVDFMADAATKDARL